VTVVWDEPNKNKTGKRSPGQYNFRTVSPGAPIEAAADGGPLGDGSHAGRKVPISG
jgi:hypothetical protein